MSEKLVEVTVPKWGLTMTEVVVIEWVKQIGDEVSRGDALCSVEAEKIDADLEATADGVLREIRVQEGDSAQVGEVVAVIGSTA
jgi:pyruvate/2-oxoglutarate dehydrogenase complex dihydrolipoamide acyltransferase (E2) component